MGNPFQQPKNYPSEQAKKGGRRGQRWADGERWRVMVPAEPTANRGERRRQEAAKRSAEWKQLQETIAASKKEEK